MWEANKPQNSLYALKIVTNLKIIKDIRDFPSLVMATQVNYLILRLSMNIMKNTHSN